MAASSNILLTPISALYGAITRTRLALYRRGMLTTHHVGVPVIGVGNITTGGTGKTPLVAWLARRLASDGNRVCILTRGYGRNDSTKQVLVSDGKTLFADAANGGDEARLLAELLVGVAAVISNADRVSAATWAIEHLKCDVFILDDAFQHLAIARDLNIVTIDSTNPWGGRKLLPRGRLREPLKGLSRADVIILTRANHASDIETLRDQAALLSNGRPVFLSQTRTTRVTQLFSDPSENDSKPPQPVLAFCALGNSASFFAHVKEDGYEVTRAESFRDHHVYSQSDVDDLGRKAIASGARSLVTTAKDAVKLRELRFSIPCYVIEIEMIFDDEKKLFELVTQAIHKRNSAQANK